jgi:uncharacterized protein (DUF1499 family)
MFFIGGLGSHDNPTPNCVGTKNVRQRFASVGFHRVRMAEESDSRKSLSLVRKSTNETEIIMPNINYMQNTIHAESEQSDPGHEIPPIYHFLMVYL